MILTAGQNVREAKLVMLGSTTVGKSSIVTRLTRDMFNPESPSTIGAAFISKSVQVGDITIKLQIWDTGGSERYRAMAPLYFQNADAAVIVYDITSKESFKDVEEWLKELREKGPSSIIIALAGNKCDLLNRNVQSETASDFAERNKIPLFKETSALDGTNILELFTDIAKMLVNGVPNKEQSGGSGVNVAQQARPQQQQQNHKCCK